MTQKKIYFWIFFTLFFTFFSYLVFDQILANFVNSYLNDETLLIFFQFITFFGSVYLVIPALILIFYQYYHQKIRGKEKISKEFLFVSFAVSISWLVTKIIKVTFARYRPDLFLVDNLYGFSYFSFEFLKNSFPSGHTTVAFAMMFALSYIFPKYRLCLFLFAALIGISRIVLGVHFLSDVIFGAFIGVFITYILKKKYFEKDF